MPTKKKKYNARFPAGRIKKIMQTDEDVGKVAQAVPVIISRTLELFVESLLKRAMQITSAKNAKTLTPSHMKQCILSESRFDFLKDLVRGIPDILSTDDESGMSVGNVSPGVSPPCVKLSSGHSCFQSRRKSDSGSSKTSVMNSQVSFVPQAMLPKFYNEITPEDDKKNDKRLEPIPCRTPVIQHTGHKVNNRSSTPSLNADQEKSPLRTLSRTCDGSQVNEEKYKICNRNSENQNSSSEEDEDDDDDDDELQENGYHRLEIVTKTCAIDEDYDT